MRVAAWLRRLLKSNVDFAKKLDASEKEYGVQFGVVFNAARDFMMPKLSTGWRVEFGADKQ